MRCRAGISTESTRDIEGFFFYLECVTSKETVELTYSGLREMDIEYISSETDK